MKTREFLSQLQHERIVNAIREAEQKTSGELRVFISRKPVEDPLRAAQAQFLSMGMNRTRQRNAVLIFVAPRSHKFAVIGDAGIHARCGDAFWRELTQELAGFFRQAEFTTGLVQAIHKTGQLLARHFPHSPDDQNELPDDVAHD